MVAAPVATYGYHAAVAAPVATYDYVAAPVAAACPPVAYGYTAPACPSYGYVAPSYGYAATYVYADYGDRPTLLWVWPRCL